MFPIPGQEEYFLCMCVCWQSLTLTHLAGKQLTGQQLLQLGGPSAWATSARGRGSPEEHNNLELLGLEGEQGKSQKKQ